jgi:predicted  nucleic acid-binding Zn-ribbon protein
MPTENISADVLRTIHRIRLQLTDLGSRLRQGPKRIHACEDNVRKQEELLAAAKERMKTMRMASDAKQVQLQGGEDKVAELKVKLNSASSNREYQALLDQIAAIEMTNSVMADEILEAFERIDDFKTTVDQAAAASEVASQQAQATQQEVEKEKPLVETDVQRLQEELRQAERLLPVDVRENYQRVVRAKGEDALAPIQGEICGGCNQRVLLNMLADLQMSKLVFCKTCGRLLYLPQEIDE